MLGKPVHPFVDAACRGAQLVRPCRLGRTELVPRLVHRGRRQLDARPGDREPRPLHLYRCDLLAHALNQRGAAPEEEAHVRAHPCGERLQVDLESVQGRQGSHRRGRVRAGAAQARPRRYPLVQAVARRQLALRRDLDLSVRAEHRVDDARRQIEAAGHK